jgi:hypothetical protein
VIRVVQIADEVQRRVALVDEPKLRLIEAIESVYALVHAAIASSTPLSELAQHHATGAALDYDVVYDGGSPWRLRPPIDNPEDPARCLVSGTGLTHVGSAQDRDAMHDAASATLTDSLRMFKEGVAGGRPAAGSIGVPPEWFYKGNGTMLRAHGEALVVPPYADDGGEEAEIAGVYVIDPRGCPRRIGMAVGNEFSDHRFERKNYLNLAGSKLRTPALGPELVLAPRFDSVPGEVWIERGPTRIWERRIASGETQMNHSLQNIEHHHFKFELHRRPGDVHVHFFGAHSLSFGEGVTLLDADVMAIRFDGFGRALRNVVRVEREDERVIAVRPLG